MLRLAPAISAVLPLSPVSKTFLPENLPAF